MKRLIISLLLLNVVLPAQAGVVIWDSGIVIEKLQEHRQNPRTTQDSEPVRTQAQPATWLDLLLSSVRPNVQTVKPRR